MDGNRRDELIQAATRIVLEHGPGQLTLNAVARAAGVSKGGLLYHFPNKDALVASMVTNYVKTFESQLVALADNDPVTAGRWTRAYINATAETEPLNSSLAAALLAASNTNPSLISVLRESIERWQSWLEDDGLSAADIGLLRLAADGFWLAELLDLPTVDEPSRSALLRDLLERSYPKE